MRFVKQAAVLVMASGALLGGVLTATANADEGVRVCRVKAKDDVNIRASASTSSTIRGSLPKGRIAVSGCGPAAGGGYSACGSSSNKWFRVRYDGVTGWVAAACVNRV